MKVKTSLIFFLFIFLVLLLSACDGQPTAKQIKEQGDKYVAISEADQRAKDAELARIQREKDAEQQRIFEAQAQSIRMTRAQYWIDLWAAWKPAIKTLGVVAISVLYFPVFATALALVYASVLSIAGSSKAFVRWLTIYSGQVPVDRDTRLPRAILFDSPQIEPVAIPEDSFLAKVQEKTGIQLMRVRGTKWTAVDMATGQVYGRLDIDVPADTSKLEVLRKAILVSIFVRGRKAARPRPRPEGEIINPENYEPEEDDVILEGMLRKVESRFAAVDISDRNRG